MKDKKLWITYLIAIAIAVLIALVSIFLEVSAYGKGAVLLVHFFSDGFFVSAVLYLGFGVLTLIAEAGNFYGLQYLGYTMVNLFSLRKERFANRKDYFTYCTEKAAKQKEMGKTSLKWVLLSVGLGCLILSAAFAVIFYQMI